METVVLRIWLPDRPGALGQVASRVGAVRADVVGIDILERDNGQVIDELTVAVPRRDVLDLLVREIEQVDGVRVEEARWVDASGHDPRLDALESAAHLVAATSRPELIARLCERTLADFDGQWAAVIEPVTSRLLATEGPAPSLRWLLAYAEGASCAADVSDASTQSSDVGYVPIPATPFAIVVGRDDRPLRARERRQIEVLGRIVHLRWVELARELRSRQAHPTNSLRLVDSGG